MFPDPGDQWNHSNIELWQTKNKSKESRQSEQIKVADKSSFLKEGGQLTVTSFHRISLAIQAKYGGNHKQREENNE